MDVYNHVKFQLCITSGSKVSRGVQNCTPPLNRVNIMAIYVYELTTVITGYFDAILKEYIENTLKFL